MVVLNRICLQKCPRFGFGTFDKILNRRKKPAVHQIVPLKPGKCSSGEQVWDYIRSPGKLLGILVNLEYQVTTISVKNLGERQSCSCLQRPGPRLSLPKTSLSCLKW